MTRHIATGLTALALFAVVGCGDTTEAPTGTTGESSDTATVEEVTTQFEQWRFKRASRVADKDIQISVDDVSCEIDSPGEATCYERVTLDSLTFGKQVQDNVWNVEYDEATAEITYAEALGQGSNSQQSASGSGVPS